MADDFGTPITSAPAEPKKNNTTLIIVLVVVAVLLCCCCIAAIAIWQLPAITDMWNSMWLPLQSLLI